MVHIYGPHIFHTNNEEVWQYVNRFSEFNRFTNAPIANYILFQTPSSVAYNADGSYAAGGGFLNINPLYQWQHKSDRNEVHRTFNTLRAEFKLVDGLTFSEKVAYDFIAGKQSVLWDRYSNDGKSAGGNFQRVLNHVQQLNTQTQVNYIKTFVK